MPSFRLTRGALVALAALFAVGCRGEGELAVSSWTLEAAEGVSSVTLPARLDGRLRPDEAYTLRTRLTLPARWRGKAVSFNVPHLLAKGDLWVGGRLIPPLWPALDDTYRGTGPRTFIIPAELSTATLDLELRLQHRFVQSGWHDTVPRLSRSLHGDPVTARVRGFNRVVGSAALATLGLIGFTYFAMFLVDRRRREFGWRALETTMALPYVLYVLGSGQRLFGLAEVAVVAATISLAAWASMYSMAAKFSLPRPSRAFAVAVGIVCLVCVPFAGPFVATYVLGPVAVTFVTAVMTFNTARMVRLALERPRRPGVLPNLLAWIAVIVCSPPDFAPWLGLPDALNGARTAVLGLSVYALSQFVALSAAHLVSLESADRLNRELAKNLETAEGQRDRIEVLNTELRRQVSERSRQLAEALARLARSAPIADELGEGTVVDERYRVVRKLGSGAMGVVYEVHRPDGGRFALKVLTQVRDTEQLARFAREAQIVSEITHPNVVGLVDVGFSASGFMYLVMDLVVGRSLRESLHRHGDPAWALPILRGIAAGLAAIHARGVVHRDLKPANVLVGDEGVKIADFGIAGLAEAPPAPSESQDENDETADDADGAELAEPPTVAELAARPAATTGTAVLRRPGSSRGRRSESPMSLTRTGFLLGTPDYMAPELAGSARNASPASDIFSFAVLAFELLTGKRAFDVPPCFASLRGDALAAAPDFAEACPELPGEVARLFQRALHLRPEERPSAEELSVALAFLDGRQADGIAVAGERR